MAPYRTGHPEGGSHVSGSRHHVLQARTGTRDGEEIPRTESADEGTRLRSDARDDRRERGTLLDGGVGSGSRQPRTLHRGIAQDDADEGFSGSDGGLSRSGG